MTTPSGVARVQLLADGTGTLTIGGSSQHVHASDVAAARAEITTRLRHHSRSIGQVVHVELSDPLGHWAMTITPQGEITTTVGAVQATPPPDLADTLFGSPTPRSQSPRYVVPQEPTAPRPPRPARSWPRPTVGRRSVAVAGALALTLAAGTALTWTITRENTTTLTLQPVQGWTQTAAWETDPIADAQNRPTHVLPVDGSLATTLRDGDTTSLATLHPDTGEVLWRQELDEPLTGNAQAVGPSRDALAATTAHSLSIWENPSDPQSQPETWTFSEADVSPVPGSEVPVLFSADTATALTVHDGQLVRRSLPGGTRAVAALPNGDVLAVSEDGHWWPVGEDRGQAHLLQPPTYGARVKSVLQVVGTTLLVTWTNGEKMTTVAGYDVSRSMAATWHVENAPGDLTQLAASPDGSWAILGTTAFDVATGDPTYLPKSWKTLRVTNEAAWSRGHVAPKLSPARVLDEPVKNPDALPLATTRAGRALVAHHDDESARIVALEPSADRAYDDGDQVITKPPAAPKPPKPKVKAKPKGKAHKTATPKTGKK